MVNKTIRAFSVILINDTSSLDLGAFCGYKVGSGENGPEVKPDCLSAARNSGQHAILGSPSKNSSPNMKMEGSIPARNGGSMNTWTSFSPEDLMDVRKGGETDRGGLAALTPFKSCNVFFSSLTSLCLKLQFRKFIIVLPNNVGHIYT